MLLRELLKTIEPITIIGDDTIEIQSVSFDTRTVTVDSIFVCIKGINSDRHAFYKTAIDNGAVCIVSAYALEGCSVTNVVVPDTNQALALISSNFYDNPEKKIRVIGVTGTNGKTTTTNLIRNVLVECGYKVGLIGTNEIAIGEDVLPSQCTTPEAPALFSYLHDMQAADCDFAIMEVSSHSIALDRVYGIKFTAGIFTNLTQDHLDFHKDMKEYADVKSKFFNMCAISIINADDAYAQVMIQSAGGKTYTYGLHSDADYFATEIAYRDDGVSYVVNGGKDPYTLHFPIPGKFSVYNSLSVCALCDALTIPDGFVRMALKKTKTVKGRCELVEIDKPFSVIIDFAHSPDGMINILSTVNEFKKGNLITVFGCGGERDRGKRPKMGKIAKEMSDIVIITSDNPRSEDMDAIIEEIAAGIADMTNVYKIADRKNAIAHALSIAKENDIILLLGKGHETVQKFKDYEIYFDEREVVKSLCD